MTEQLLDFAQGPLFRLTFVVMLAGLGRRLFLILWSSGSALIRSHNKNLKIKAIASNIVEWLFPFSHVGKSRRFFSTVSYIFHIGVILVPVLLAEHITLWRQGIHLGWPALPGLAADILTWTTILTGIGLLITRVSYRPARLFSSAGDYLITILVIVPFLTGYMAQSGWTPFSYNMMMLIHILSAEIIFVLIPFSKLAHCFLFPFTRLATEVGSKFAIDIPETYPYSAEGSEL
ncbi:MAG: hypothetical protein ABIH23_28830 [bacterium]